MKGKVCIGCLTIALTLIGSRVKGDPVENETGRQPAAAKFVVYSSREDADWAPSLIKVLHGKDEGTPVAGFDTIEKAIASKAEVLVCVMSGHAAAKIEKSTLDTLKKQKIVGIGNGAAELFGQMGLEINDEACAFHTSHPIKMSVMKSRLFGDSKQAGSFVVLLQSTKDEPDANKYDAFGMFIPRRSHHSSLVEVIARWTDDPNYAPIVRQGNCILVGLPVPAAKWTPAYADFFKDLCISLHDRKLEAFSTAHWEVTKPGTYKFKLAMADSTDDLFDKTFYFQFSEATRFTARLEHRGSNSVSLVFSGDDRAHWTRKDSKDDGPALEIASVISREDIQKLAGRYWTLSVTNYDPQAPTDCILTIKCEQP